MKNFEYQHKGRFFAQITGSMEDYGKEELEELGATNIDTAYRGLYFDADLKAIYRINYASRLISRVLAPLASFPANHTDQLYKMAKKIEWDQIFTFKQTFAIFSQVSNSKIHHSKYAALRLKDAIADYFREKYRYRPSVDRETPDVWLNLHLENNRATISLDVAGGALHKRQYRRKTDVAPMQETLAAAIIRLSGWDGSRPLYDPMCGTGTLLSEALMHYCRLPANYQRKNFGFKHLPDYDQNEWEAVQLEMSEQIRPLPSGLIAGSDSSYKAVSAAKYNNRHLMYGDRIKVKVADALKLKDLQDKVIVTNPPYGIRMGNSDAVAELYEQLGDHLKQHCKGSVAYIYFGDRTLIGAIGLKPARKIPLISGALDGRLAKFEIY